MSRDLDLVLACLESWGLEHEGDPRAWRTRIGAKIKSLVSSHGNWKKRASNRAGNPRLLGRASGAPAPRAPETLGAGSKVMPWEKEDEA